MFNACYVFTIRGFQFFFLGDMLYSRGCMLEGFGWLYAPPRPQNLQHVKWYPFQEKIPHICSSSRELIRFGCSVLDKESQNPNAIGRCIGVLKKRTLPKAYLLFKHKTARSRDILSELNNRRCEKCNTESRAVLGIQIVSYLTLSLFFMLASWNRLI